MKQAVEFLKEMLRLKSVNPPGDEAPVARLIESLLREQGIEAAVKDLGDNRAYLVARLKGNGKKKSLVFTGHMDTVPPGEIEWVFDPYMGIEQDGKIYGRGTSDMKSGLAAMIWAMIEIVHSGTVLEGDLVLAATAGEEVDCLGARAMVEDGLLSGVGAMVVGEPSNGEIFIAHKGALWLELISYGKTAHGSMPDQGINAIEHMTTAMDRLRDRFTFKYSPDALLGGPTLNLATISGGVKTNVVPDKCQLQIDIRTVPGQNHDLIIQDIRTLLLEIQQESSARFELRVLNDKAPVGTPGNNQFVKLVQTLARDQFARDFGLKGVRYFTDASVFSLAAEDEFPIVIWGPGDEKLAHQPNEYVEVEKFKSAIVFYQRLAEKYLST